MPSVVQRKKERKKKSVALQNFFLKEKKSTGVVVVRRFADFEVSLSNFFFLILSKLSKLGVNPIREIQSLIELNLFMVAYLT